MPVLCDTLKTERLGVLDFARGISVLLMIVYHFMFDLDYFGIWKFGVYTLPIVLFQRIIGFSFVFLFGISSGIMIGRKVALDRHFKRSILLALTAMAITAATWVYPNRGFITFGIIHFFAISAFLVPFFGRLGRINMLVGAFIVVIGLILNGMVGSDNNLVLFGLAGMDYEALDYYPLLPWFGIMIFGLEIGKEILEPDSKMNILLKRCPKLENGLVELIGKKSLAIYLVHQPVIIGILVLFSQ